MYKVGDKVLLKNAWTTKFNQDAYLGPYTIAAVHDNGTVRARKGRVTDMFNLLNITSFTEKCFQYGGVCDTILHCSYKNRLMTSKET